MLLQTSTTLYAPDDSTALLLPLILHILLLLLLALKLHILPQPLLTYVT